MRREYEDFEKRNSLYEIQPDMSYLENFLFLLLIIEMIQGGANEIITVYSEINDWKVFICYVAVGILCIMLPSALARALLPFMYNIVHVQHKYRKLIESYIVTAVCLLSFYCLYCAFFQCVEGAKLLQFICAPIERFDDLLCCIANREFLFSLLPNYLASRVIHFVFAFIYLDLCIIGSDYILIYGKRENISSENH
jgi:H+/Cl- antiporter ClcA